MQVTIHLEPGQTDRDLARALLALDPSAQVHLVSGRNGRAGVRVDGHLAGRYLSARYALEQVGLFDPAGVLLPLGETVGAGTQVVVAEPEAASVGSDAVVVVEPVVQDKPKPPAKKAAAKKAAAAKPEGEVNP